MNKRLLAAMALWLLLGLYLVCFDTSHVEPRTEHPFSCDSVRCQKFETLRLS